MALVAAICLLPFPWLARHKALLRRMQVAAGGTVLLLGIAFASTGILTSGRSCVALWFASVPPAVASWLIARAGRRQRIDYAATFD